MADERIARALILLGENADLFAADREGLLDLIEDYFDDRPTSGNSPAHWHTQQLIFSVYSLL